jgi:hypothetical protein
VSTRTDHVDWKSPTLMKGKSSTVNGSSPPHATALNTDHDSAQETNSRPVVTAMAMRPPPLRQAMPASIAPSSGASTSATAGRASACEPPRTSANWISSAVCTTGSA